MCYPSLPECQLSPPAVVTFGDEKAIEAGIKLEASLSSIVLLLCTFRQKTGVAELLKKTPGGGGTLPKLNFTARILKFINYLI